nr:TRAP transporter TatT component family protein [Azoarcus sp. L1K30]
MVIAVSGCSVQQLAVDRLGDALAAGGDVFAQDDDPELIRDASPFSLKLIETLLSERPRHAGLLLAASRGFTQYAYAFVQQQADETEAQDLDRAFALRERACKLYRRARDYGLTGLDVRHPGVVASLRASPQAAVAQFGRGDVAQLYWTGAAWAAMISLSKDDPDAVADLPLVSALLDRALALDADFDAGALHTLMISYEMARTDGLGDRAARAREHYRQAVELTGGRQAGPHVALAEAIALAQQDRAGFVRALDAALAVDAAAAPRWQVANLVSQRRARWLLSQIDTLFVD